MDDSTKVFHSHDGTLRVGADGLSIERNFTQALKAGKLLQRQQYIPFTAIDKIGHRQAVGRPGHLQFTMKHGAPGATPLTRHPKIKFQTHQSHQFRQAQRLIQNRLSNLNTTN